jgi:hypothetical protein
VAIELAHLTLEKLTHVAVSERARLARHAVPGLAGDLSQALGRSSVTVELRGAHFGATAADDLGQLRQLYLDQQPVDFFADAIGAGYFSQVLISRLEVRQRAGALDEFEFAVEVMEYVEPPEPVTADPFAALDAGLLDEAAAFMDDVQNAVEAVSDLVDALANLPGFGDPTQRLRDMPSGYQNLVGGSGVAPLSALKDLF